MFFKRSHGCLLGMMWGYLLAFSALSWGGAEETGAPREVWRDFGRLLLYRSGTGRCSSAEWLNRELDVLEPDSRLAAGAAKTILTEAFAGYGQGAIAVVGRIPLDINPRCILGFHLAERFSGTSLGDWGGRQFDQCIEQACLVAMSDARDTWRARLGAELLTTDDTQRSTLPAEVFGAVEAPYLYHYLVSNAGSTDTRNKARERLARCLWQGYGLEPGLRQYLILFDQGCEIDGTWLEVAKKLERTGANSRAKRIYARILRSTDSGEQARNAFESLARILLLESRQREARSALGILSRRFPDVDCTAPDIKDFLNNFQFNRAEMATGLLSRLAKTTNGPRALQLCRLFDALWSPQEALRQWQGVADRAEPGSLADQFGRVFLARAMLNAGKTDASQAPVRGLTESPNPLVQAQSIAVSAEIARAKGNIAESARLYSRAVQVDRPTALPRWYKELVPVRPPDAGTPTPGLQAQTLFLRGCNELIDGDYAAAADSLSRVAQDPHSLPNPLQRVLPCTMMLAWLGLGDEAQAEAWGYQAAEKCGLDNLNHAGIRALSAKIQNVDVAISRLLAKVRDQATDEPSAVAALQDAIDLCDAVTVLDDFVSRPGGVESDIQQMYVRAKKRHVARVLEAEYHYAKRRLAGSGTKEHMSSQDSLLFVAQILGEESFDRIRESLSAVTNVDGVNDRMYRLALFARRAKHLDLAKSALDAAASEQSSAANAETLERIAEMYLAFSNHQKAIDAYERIVAKAEDPGKARIVRLKIIDIYAESLKNYGKAIQECQKFIRRHPDSVQTSQVEFLIGRLSYLSRDYAGAVGQLDGFWKRYPEHPQVGQAMLLAGLSRMAEGNINEAIGRFTETIQRYPDGELAARSKFLIGYAQLSGQQYAAASETFKQLIEQFPQSQYVTQAESLLDRLSRIPK
ncbi:MAG: tetratricopeptide repeat protein [Planctomycetota bacterium]|jgi:TolA-binding protein